MGIGRSDYIMHRVSSQAIKIVFMKNMSVIYERNEALIPRVQFALGTFTRHQICCCSVRSVNEERTFSERSINFNLNNYCLFLRVLGAAVIVASVQSAIGTASKVVHFKVFVVVLMLSMTPIHRLSKSDQQRNGLTLDLQSWMFVSLIRLTK